jgi:hypothetical protein
MQDKLKERFEKERSSIDHEPDMGHRNRFINRLDKEMNHSTEGFQLNVSYQFMRTAAAVAILITSISFAWFWDQSSVNTPDNRTMTLADVSEKYKEVEFFYQDQMQEKLSNLASEDNEKGNIIYNEALQKMEQLEVNYIRLEKDLTLNPGNARIVFAMIKNYQLRIKVLETLLQKLNIKETQKTEENEKANLYPISPIGIHLTPFTA